MTSLATRNGLSHDGSKSKLNYPVTQDSTSLGFYALIPVKVQCKDIVALKVTIECRERKGKLYCTKKGRGLPSIAT